MKTVFLKNNPDRSFSRKIPALLLAGLVTFSACSGSNNTSSTPIPLPNGQAGSLQAYNSSAPADCFATTTNTLTLCSSSTSPTAAKGTGGGVTALGTFLSSGSSSVTPSLVAGTSQGTVSVVSNVSGTPTTPFFCTGLSSKITAIAGVSRSATSANIFAAVGNTLYKTSTSTSTCTAFSTATLTTSATAGNITGLAIYGTTLFGVTINGYYFSISNANTTTASPSTPQFLPNYPISGPVINGMAIDPNGLVFFADASMSTSNNGGQITIYHVSSTGTTISPNNVQSYSGNNNGVAISAPIGIAVSETSIPNSNYCSTGSCDYIYLLNSGNIIQQYVMPIPSPPLTGGVSINPFNLPYTGCEMTNPVAITSFPDLISAPFTTSGSSASSGPLVFLGNNGSYSAGSCFGTTSSYGNNVVSYGIKGE